MTFWSGDALEANGGGIIHPFSKDLIDCAAYQLSIGPEIYVTPHVELVDSHTVTKRNLSERENFTIPAGQFAFLLTEESLSIPYSLIGFISVRAKTKFKGLVNVSGFHVDPGYKGRLIFSVYNAGPAPIHLRRGEEIFLLWIADLDESASAKYAKNGPPRTEISNDLINKIPGEIHSLQSLSKIISKVEKKVDISATKMNVYFALIFLALAILLRGPLVEDFGRLIGAFNKTVGPNSTSTEVPDQQQNSNPE